MEKNIPENGRKASIFLHFAITFVFSGYFFFINGAGRHVFQMLYFYSLLIFYLSKVQLHFCSIFHNLFNYIIIKAIFKMNRLCIMELESCS